MKFLKGIGYGILWAVILYVSTVFIAVVTTLDFTYINLLNWPEIMRFFYALFSVSKFIACIALRSEIS